MLIPKDPNYPHNAVQCNNCGGNGCEVCEDRGWLTPADHSGGRRCYRSACDKPILPTQFTVYCSDECARLDA